MVSHIAKDCASRVAGGQSKRTASWRSPGVATTARRSAAIGFMRAIFRGWCVGRRRSRAKELPFPRRRPQQSRSTGRVRFLHEGRRGGFAWGDMAPTALLSHAPTRAQRPDGRRLCKTLKSVYLNLDTSPLESRLSSSSEVCGGRTPPPSSCAALGTETPKRLPHRVRFAASGHHGDLEPGNDSGTAPVTPVQQGAGPR